MKTKALLALMLSLLVINGCTLSQQVPKTTFIFNPVSREVEVSSPKDVRFDTLVAQISGTNCSLSISNYQSQANIEVIKAAVTAMQNQQQAIVQGLQAALAAAATAAK